LMVLVGVEVGDEVADADWLASKTAGSRIFVDQNGVINNSFVAVDGHILVIRKFTFPSSTRKGNRPSYIRAAGHDLAVPLYECYCAELARLTGHEPQRGIFGADMKVSLVNDGPVTIIIDSRLKE
ncbi:MAG: D-tyrosyl-tRNA(Tyr) deacylase, partial [Muribaculaceae bacterium]|nr:D-tyrosyl-tRNA(Tyr) deacylase [Muribaculaceae bacterium]